MKLKTAFKILFTPFFFLFSLLSLTKAQTYVPVDTYDVIINANITSDLYTQLDLVPFTVEIKQPSLVNILSLNSNGTPRAGRNIIIYILGDSTGTTLVQPALTDLTGRTVGSVSSTIPGVYTVCARDMTEGYEILIADCEALYVIPVPAPVIIPEPQYTKGNSNIIMWNMSGLGIYQYYTEVSKDASFVSIENSSGWISNAAYEFKNLDNGQMYFYRVKARNSFGGESGWSDTVFSVQDSVGPSVDLISISDIAEYTTSEWFGNFTVNIKYRIKDNIGINSREFWCVGRDDGKYECEYIATISGDFWNISIKLKDLERSEFEYLFNEYKFCVEASDLVGNITRNCEATLTVPDTEITDEEKPPSIFDKPVLPTVPILNSIKKVLDDLVSNTIGKLKPIDMQTITITSATANIAVGIGMLLTALGNIPYFLLQLIFAVLSLFGFRKRGNITGYVYDSVTKEPITQAIVRVFNENNELVWTDVTDSYGYFRSIELEDGEYYIKVTARNYNFPSKIVFGRTDFPLERVYHGDPFLTKNQKIPNFSIPMDQKEVSTFRKFFASLVSRTKALGKVLHLLLFIFGLLFSIYALYTTHVWWNYMVVLIYIPALIVLIFPVFNKKEKYGIVRDEKRKIIKGAIIGLNEKEFGKLVSKRVTDDFGRYKFIVNDGIFSISVLNSDLKVLNKEKLETLEAKKKGGNILCPNILVKRLEDSNKREKLGKPLKDL